MTKTTAAIVLVALPLAMTFAAPALAVVPTNTPVPNGAPTWTQAPPTATGTVPTNTPVPGPRHQHRHYLPFIALEARP